MNEKLLREIVEISGESSIERILRKTNAATKRLVPGVEVNYQLDGSHLVSVEKITDLTHDQFEIVELLAKVATLAISSSKSGDLANRLQINEERLRIARDLHDRVLQRIFATGISLEGALRKAVVEDVIKALKQAIIDLDETVGQIRSTVHSLKGPASSIRQRVLNEIEQARTNWNMVIDFTMSGPIDSVIPKEMYNDVLAVTAELLNNCGKHASVKKAKYVLTATGDELEITVINAISHYENFKHGSGFDNLSARAAKYGGQLLLTNLEPNLRVDWKIIL